VRGATWTRDGTIVFAGQGRGLSVVPANGGAPRSLTEPSAGSTHTWPDAVPDGGAVVFTVAAADMRQRYAGIVSMRTRSWARLLDDVSAVRASVPGYLVAQRGTDLVAVAFDGRAASVAGLPVSIVPDAIEMTGAPRFATSAGGTLVIASPSRAAHVVLDWTAELRRLVSPPAVSLPR